MGDGQLCVTVRNQSAHLLDEGPEIALDEGVFAFSRVGGGAHGGGRQEWERMGVKEQRAFEPNPAFGVFPAKTPSHKNQNGKLSGDRCPAITESGRQRDLALLYALSILAYDAFNRPF